MVHRISLYIYITLVQLILSSLTPIAHNIQGPMTYKLCIIYWIKVKYKYKKILHDLIKLRDLKKIKGLSQVCKPILKLPHISGFQREKQLLRGWIKIRNV